MKNFKIAYLMMTLNCLTIKSVYCSDLVSYSFNPKLVLSDHLNDSIKIQPTTGLNFSTGFSMCFRHKFHFWNVNEILTSETLTFGFGNYSWPSGFFKIGKMWYFSDWPDAIERSPYVWYSTCLAFKAAGFEVSLVLNGQTTLNISDKVHLKNNVFEMETFIQVFTAGTKVYEQKVRRDYNKL